VFWPPVVSGSTNLFTLPASPPYIVPGQPYYLTITNPNPVAISFAYVVWFDTTPLPNCTLVSNVVAQAGIPRYFQFDVPTTGMPPGTAQAVSFFLTGAPGVPVGLTSNLTVVLSQHLPLPDLTHFDYISAQPSTNNDVLLVVTNTTPFPLQDNRWYVGVFNQAVTPVPFLVQACVSSNYPVIIPLTNGVPFVADLASPYVAPPGPPQWVFFQFQLTNYVDGVLFELYNLSGDADLVLQRDVPPGIPPYFDGSFSPGLNPEHIVLRTGPELGDLRGNWFLGVFNNEANNVAYTLRAATEQGGLLLSAQPLMGRLAPLAPPRGLLYQWNSIEGEHYIVEFTTNIKQGNWAPVGPLITATTPLTTLEVPRPVGGVGFYRVRQVSALTIPHPQLTIQLWPGNRLRIYWSTNFPNETLQYSTLPSGPWANLGLPVVVEGAEYVVYDGLGPGPRFYRLIP
jgi:hypothetical protein